MRHSIFAIMALAASVSLSAAAEQPKKLWEASGFENPESAVADTTAGVIYVSNVNGKPDGKDGNGYISKMSLDGKVTDAKWITGLDGPKGLGLSKGRLFVADIDKLVEIDVAAGAIAAKYEAAGAKILNDVAVGPDGTVYVSDWPANAIWRLSGGKFEKWLESDQLKSPNGLLVEGDKLIVAAWGAMAADFSTKVPGNLLTVSLTDKTIANLGDGKPVGNLDGLEPFDAQNFIVSDWIAGKIFLIARSGAAKEILALGQGNADFSYLAATRTLIVPQMVEGKVIAYKF